MNYKNIESRILNAAQKAYRMNFRINEQMTAWMEKRPPQNELNAKQERSEIARFLVTINGLFIMLLPFAVAVNYRRDSAFLCSINA